MSILFTKSFEELNAHYPWDERHITSLHKKGSKWETGNSRPVCRISFFVKCYHWTHGCNHLFSDNQHGFVPGRLCMTDMLINDIPPIIYNVYYKLFADDTKTFPVKIEWISRTCQCQSSGFIRKQQPRFIKLLRRQVFLGSALLFHHFYWRLCHALTGVR